MSDACRPSSVGDHVTVTTNDGHRFEGFLLEIRLDRFGRELAVLRLDSGWVTSYPLGMVRVQPPNADERGSR